MYTKAWKTIILALGLMGAHAWAFGQTQPRSPGERYQSMLKEQQALPDELAKAKTEEEKRAVIARMGKLPHRFLELAEGHPKDPIAIDSLVQVVAIVNGSAFPAGGKDSPGTRALEILQRDHVRSEKLGRVCQLIAFGFHRNHEALLRAILEVNPHREVQALACLSLAQFLNNRLDRLAVLEDQDGRELADRYERVFGKGLLEELKRQDRSKVGAEVEALFVRAAADYPEVKIPVTYYGSGGTVGEKSKTDLFYIRHLAVGKLPPDIEGQDQDGNRFKLSDYRGKVVLLDFWHHL